MTTSNHGIWGNLLLEFQEIVKDEPKPTEVKEKLIALSEKAKSSSELTYRQTDAINARVQNYINETYGKTKRPEHYDHIKPNSKNNSTPK